MINAGKSIWATSKLNTARSSKYKISTSLFMYCCISSSAFCSTWHSTNRILRIAVSRTTLEESGKYMTKNLTFISQRMEHFCLFGYLNQLGKYGYVVFIQLHFRPTGKKTPWVAPFPSEIYLFQTPLPLGISVTFRGGYGYFLELHITQKYVLISSGQKIKYQRWLVAPRRFGWL